MPWNNNSGGPWGDGNGSGDGGNPWGQRPNEGGGGGNNRGSGGQPPDLDELFRQGQERFKKVLGGGGGGGNGGGGGFGGGLPFKALAGIVAIAALAVWLFASLFTVQTNERAIVLTLGEYSAPPRGPGLNLAYWPIQTYEIVDVSTQRQVTIGASEVRVRGRSQSRNEGLMLTGDENVVDVNFQIDWNITDPAAFLFNLVEPESTIEAVSEASIREVIGNSEIQPVLNRDGIITNEVAALVQGTLDGYETGVNIIRVNFVQVQPPELVEDAFDDVTRATQEQEQKQLAARGYARQKLAEARGEAAQLVENAQGYTARVVKDAEGEAARFKSIQTEYAKAPAVTRQRLYLETMERVLGGIDKVILDSSITGGGGSGGGSGVVPYLPLNELRKGGN